MKGGSDCRCSGPFFMQSVRWDGKIEHCVSILANPDAGTAELLGVLAQFIEKTVQP